MPLGLTFPRRGIIENVAYGETPAGFLLDALNMRPFDTAEDRVRGGPRPGSGYGVGSGQVNGDNPIQRMVQGNLARRPGDFSNLLFDYFSSYADGDMSGNSSGEWSDFRIGGASYIGGTNLMRFSSGTVIHDRGASNQNILGVYTGSSITLATIYRLRTVVTVDASDIPTDDASGGIIFRCNYPTTAREYLYAAVVVTGASTGNVVLRDDAYSTIATAALPAGTVSGSLASSVALAVTVDSNSVVVSVNGSTLLTETVATYSANTVVGLYAHRASSGPPDGDNPITFKNFLAQDGGNLSAGFRETYLGAVVGGDVYLSDSPPTTMTLATDGSGALDTSTYFMAAVEAPPSPSDTGGVEVQRHIYFCDATNYKRLNLETATVSTWTADAGDLPDDDSGNVGYIMCLWRSRMVIAGVLEEPGNWFMSAVGDVLDWNYGPVPAVATQAVAGHNADAGQVADILTALIPLSDDLLIFGGSRSLSRMTGDPAAGGTIDAISETIGIVGPDAWARASDGTVYFMSTDGLYRMAPNGSGIQGLSSGRLDKTFGSIDLTTTRVILAWNTDEHGLHIFLTPLAEPGAAPTHYWWDDRSDGFWPEQYPISNGPTCVLAFDGDLPDDRALYMGGFDSRIYQASGSNIDDRDGASTTAMNTYFEWPPIMAGGFFHKARINRMQFILGGGSDDVTVGVYTGQDAEDVVEKSSPRFTTTVSGGRNPPWRKPMTAQAIRIRLSQNAVGNDWSFEAGEMEIAPVGKVTGNNT